MRALVEKVAEAFYENKQSLGFAESCTGGALSAQLVELSGVSAFFKGAVVSYAGSVKERLLNVSAQDIKEFGEVSEPVALQMAQGAQKALDCDWAVSITGVAGPTGGTDEKPVGTVCFGVVGPQFEKVKTFNFNPQEERQKIQSQSVEQAFCLLLEGLKH